MGQRTPEHQEAPAQQQQPPLRQQAASPGPLQWSHEPRSEEAWALYFATRSSAWWSEQARKAYLSAQGGPKAHYSESEWVAHYRSFTSASWARWATTHNMGDWMVEGPFRR